MHSVGFDWLVKKKGGGLKKLPRNARLDRAARRAAKGLAPSIFSPLGLVAWRRGHTAKISTPLRVHERIFSPSSS